MNKPYPYTYQWAMLSPHQCAGKSVYLSSYERTVLLLRHKKLSWTKVLKAIPEEHRLFHNETPGWTAFHMKEVARESGHENVHNLRAAVAVTDGNLYSRSLFEERHAEQLEVLCERRAPEGWLNPR